MFATCVFHHSSSIRHRAERLTASCGQPAAEDGGVASCACASPGPDDDISHGRLATRSGQCLRGWCWVGPASERPDPGGGEEACQPVGGGRGERAARWRRPHRADAVVERGVGKVGGVVEAKRSREIILFFWKGHGWEHDTVANAGDWSVPS
jgi:hypothetical protein